MSINFQDIYVWANNNHDALEALAALGAVVISIILVCVTAGLWRATNRLAISTKDLAAGAARQADEIAKATILAEKQFLMAGQQADLAGKQNRLQRLQYIAEHRPIIQIRSIGLESSGKGGQLIHSGMPIKGSLVVVNGAASEATVLEAEYRFYWSQTGLPMVPPLSSGAVKDLMSDLPHRMAGHESCLVKIESDEANVFDPDVAVSMLLGGPWRLYVMGAVRYQDRYLKERWMGFCREYKAPEISGGEGRFVPVDNSDYEYSD